MKSEHLKPYFPASDVPREPSDAAFPPDSTVPRTRFNGAKLPKGKPPEETSTSLPELNSMAKSPANTSFNSLPDYFAQKKGPKTYPEIYSFIDNLKANGVDILVLDSSCIYTLLDNKKASDAFLEKGPELTEKERAIVQNRIDFQKIILEEFARECAKNKINIALFTHAPSFDDDSRRGIMSATKAADKSNVCGLFLKNFHEVDSASGLETPVLGIFTYFKKNGFPQWNCENIIEALEKAVAKNSQKAESAGKKSKNRIFFWGLDLDILKKLTEQKTEANYTLCADESIATENFKFIADLEFLEILTLKLYDLKDSSNPKRPLPPASCSSTEGVAVAAQPKSPYLL